jgi:hypothetical protein
MRKFLLASVATLGTGGLAGAALAQTPPGAPVPAPLSAPAPISGPIGAPTQGQQAWPAAPAPTAYVNNNNNYQAPMLPGALANPTPGTIVVHFNGKVQIDVQGSWTSLDNHLVTATARPLIGNATTAPAGSPGGPAIAAGAMTPTATAVGNNGIGSVKLQPQSVESFGRIYAGGDGMATNGLRYGAAIEIRQNFTGQISGSGSSGASGYSSLETLYVRRAFTYFAGDNWGIVRAGQADGLIGIFDNGVTTFQFLPTGNLNGGDATNFAQNASAPFVFMGQAGNEYDNAKLVYLSPQIAGFDFGLQYAPSTANGNGQGGSNLSLNNSITGSGTGTGLGCTIANTGCPNLSSGPGIQDGARALNQTAVGVRYQGAFGSLGLLAYGVYMISQAADYTGLTTPAILGTTTTPGSKFNGTYNGLSIGSGGVAATFAGFTVGGNIIGGKMNGQMGLQPSGGAPLLGVLAGAKYVYGPFTVGIVGEEYWEQGTVTLAGLSQRRARGLSTGVGFTVAPGFSLFAEYLYMDQQQSGFNFLTGATGVGALGAAAGANANNYTRAQTFLIGNVVNF